MKIRIALLGLIIFLIFIFFYLGLGQYTNLDYLKTQQIKITDYNNSHPFKTTLVFFLTYITITAISIPGATIITLASGVIFGLIKGTVLVSFASTIGATLAFLTSRFLFRDALQNKFSDKLHMINQGIDKDGIFYLFALRLVPIFPFFMVNLIMGLTPIKASSFFFISQLGMLAGTIVYVYAGTKLADIESLKDILSPELIFSFALLGLLPITAKKIVDTIRKKRQLSKTQSIKNQY